MATKPKQTSEDILADARQVVARARAHWKDFAKADAGRKRKLLDPSVLQDLDKAITAAEKAIGGQSAGKGALIAATTAEVKLRGQLFQVLVAIRDDVKLAYPDDRVLARSFGVGKTLPPKSTPRLLSAASVIEEAYALAEQKRAASQAGVTPARIAQLAKLRAALASADTSQNTTISARKGATVVKDDLLGRVRKGAAHIRKVARHVFRGNAPVLAQFGSTTPRRATKKRAVSPPPPAATPPSASAPAS